MDLTGPIWYPYTQMQTAREPLKIVSGEGVYIKDDQGVDYIDAISSWWVNIHGHANPAIAKAISEQALILEQVIFAGCTHEPAIKLANELLRKCNMPNGKVYYSDNGSTAVEIAVKMAIQYFYNSDKPRTKILTWENDFHGETFGAMSVSDQGGLNAAFTDLMFETIKIPIPKKPDDEETFDKISKIAAGNDIAAFIFEPLVQGAGGMVIYDAEILEKTISIVKKSGAIIIADEVMTCFYRTGTFLATDQINIKPDILCLAKGLTGGFLPLSVTVCNDMIFQGFLSQEKKKALFHGHSYTANPLGCVAALASISLTEEPSFIENLEKIKTILRAKSISYQTSYPILNARYCGTIFAIDIPTKDEGYFSTQFNEINEYFLERNVFLRPLGNVLYIMPPLVISSEELHYIFQKIDDFIKTIIEM